MKKFNLMILCVALSLAGIHAQKPIKITEDSIAFSTFTAPGVVVCIPEVNYESVQKNWVKELESGTKSKAVYEKGEWSVMGAIMKDISPAALTVYSKLANQDSMVKMMVSMELKKDVYIEKGSSEGELVKMENRLKEFAKNQYIALAEEQLKEEERKLKELEKELSSHQKDETGFEKSIRSDEKNIREAEDNLVVLNNELNTLTAEIAAQNTELNTLAEGAARDEKTKYIKDLEKRKKKLMNDIKSANNHIDRSKDDIRDANADIPKAQTMQKEASEKIAAQESVVRKFEEKLNVIKSY